MNLGLWRPRIILSKQRNISKTPCRSRQKYFGDTHLVHSARPSGMPHRCFTRGICELVGCPHQPPPCHWQSKPEGETTAVPQDDPVWWKQWQFPSPTWACSSVQSSFSPGYTPALPVPTVWGKLGTGVAIAPLAPTPQWSIAEPPPHCLSRDQEKKTRWAVFPCSAWQWHHHYWNLRGGFATGLKTGGSGLEVCYAMKIRLCWQVKVGPNFSNQMLWLNLTFPG